MRELRQHASRYLARVRSGETIEVTDRGRPVARLVPIRERSWQDLVDDGVVNAPEDPELDVMSVAPLVPAPGRRLPSELLDDDRDGR